MLIVGSPELVRRQAMPVGAGAMEAIVALFRDGGPAGHGLIPPPQQRCLPPWW